MKRKLEFAVPEEMDGAKLIHFLRSHVKMSYRLAMSLKQYPDGMMRNGEKIRTVDKVKAGEIIEINIPQEESSIEPINIPIDVIYEDEDILLINKQAGLAMHPTHNHQGDTLANAVAFYLSEKGDTGAFRSIGRLDKDTSGIVLCALNPFAASRLSDELRAGEIKKTYYAVVQGEYSGEGTVDVPIYRPDPMKTLRAAGEKGDRAVTHWKCIKSGKGLSLLEINLETGRTHQIRVHFSHLGTPLAGDDMYGGSCEMIKRHALHCGRLEFMHPVTGEKMCITSPLPQDMQRLADTIWHRCMFMH